MKIDDEINALFCHLDFFIHCLAAKKMNGKEKKNVKSQAAWG